MTVTIDDVLARARSGLDRLEPAEAAAAHTSGALIVDIRPVRYRELEGEIPGSVVIERNVLEWRLDPSSDARMEAAAYDRQVVVICNEGYTSSLAAAALQELGISRATDVAGGFRAWRARGLPVVAGTTPEGEFVAG